VTTATIDSATTAGTSAPKKAASSRTASRRRTNTRTSASERATAPRKATRQPSRSRAAPRNATAASQASQQPATTHIGAAPGRAWPVGHALLAAERSIQRNSLHLRLPIIGELRLPGAEEVAFIGGVAVLAVVGVVEWPIAVLLGVGHTLSTNRGNKVVRAFGEALEEV
jgi:hypothetical protein